MKKLISVFAALLMLLSVVSMAFAENSYVAAGDSASVTVTEAGDVVVVSGDAAAETPAATGQTETSGASGETSATPSAQSTETITVTPQEVEEAGVTPDHKILWGLERATERIRLALTFNKAAKAKRGLAYANERLSELKLMVKENKAEAAEKAAEAEEAEVGEVEESATEVSEDDAAEELKTQEDIKSRIERQQAHMLEVKNAILARMQSKWTPEKYAKISGNFERIEAKYANLSDKVAARQEKIKTKLHAKTGNITGDSEDKEESDDSESKDGSKDEDNNTKDDSDDKHEGSESGNQSEHEDEED